MSTRHPTPRVIAVIPARGGSKGVPGKNLQHVGGIPLITRAVASARGAVLIDDVFVSTDSADVADAARIAGGVVIDRPEKLSGDISSSEAALEHALDTLESDPDILVFMQATSPFIDPADLDAAIARIVSGECDVIFSAALTHAFLWREGDDGATGTNHDESFRLRRQDTAPQYKESGAFYVMRVDGFRQAGFRFFGQIGIAIVPELTAVEIDCHDNLDLARAIATLVDGPPPVHRLTRSHEQPWSTPVSPAL
jgi:CMP-N-acetylneuraminic acid synthetase